MIASCGFMEEELRQCGKKGVTVADSLWTLGVDLIENQSKVVGSQRKSEKKEVQSEILACTEEKILPEELHEGGWSRSCYEQVRYQQGRGECVWLVWHLQKD